MAENAKVLLEISFETVVQKFSSPAARRVSFPDFTSKGVHILGFRVKGGPAQCAKACLALLLAKASNGFSQISRYLDIWHYLDPSVMLSVSGS